MANADDRAPLLRAVELRVGYDKRGILPPITATIAPGELWAVIGPNGAGKSTFVRTLLGLQPPVTGRVECAPGLRMSYVPQQSALDTIFPISVAEFVLMGRQGPGKFFGLAGRSDRDAARAALAEVDAADAGAPPAARSVGRPAPARADRARDRQPRGAVRPRRADVGAGHRRRAAGAWS